LVQQPELPNNHAVATSHRHGLGINLMAKLNMLSREQLGRRIIRQVRHEFPIFSCWRIFSPPWPGWLGWHGKMPFLYAIGSLTNMISKINYFVVVDANIGSANLTCLPNVRSSVRYSARTGQSPNAVVAAAEKLIMQLRKASNIGLPATSLHQFCFRAATTIDWINWKQPILISILAAMHQEQWHHGTPNALHPDRMTAAERLGELASILAAGLIRLQACKSRQLSSDRGDSYLDLSTQRSGHEPVETKTETNS
jgi:hypothetical protein